MFLCLIEKIICDMMAYMKKICVNEDILKIIAVISMTIDHAARCGVLDNINGLLTETVGRLAFPIFGFLIMKHFAANIPNIFKKYVVRLSFFGIITMALLLPFGQENKLNILFTFLWPILFVQLLQYPFCTKQAKSFFLPFILGMMVFVILFPLVLITDYWFVGFFYLIALYSWFKFIFLCRSNA